jgi:radical SAM superfamily enzyme YgiQ (UPF0313 family)
MRRNPKLLLILPKRTEGESRELWDMKYMAKMLGVRKYSTPPLSLPILAALTPDEFEIEIIDEHVEPVDFDNGTDIVGISCMTPMSARAYEIADEFKKRGKTVVLGGIHPSLLPEEASSHADSVVVGEAENTWPTLLGDYRNGSLKKFYKSGRRANLRDLLMPRWDLVKNQFYVTHIIQASRGCPFDCEFCSVSTFLGREICKKPVENIIKEIEFLKKIDRHKTMVFCDDNFAVDKVYVKKLLRALIKMDLTWTAETSIGVAEDTELLDLIAESGGKQLFIGFESLSQGNLDLMNKGGGGNKVEKYSEAISKIQSYGIAVIGGFILGYDFDDETVFEKTVNFINDTNMMSAQINILSVYPGTRLYSRLKAEGRILDEDWQRRSHDKVSFVPKQMAAETLLQGYYWVMNKVFSLDSISKRLKGFWQGQKRKERTTSVSFAEKAHLLTRGIWSQDKDKIILILRHLFATEAITSLEDRMSNLLSNLSFNNFSAFFPKVEYPKRFLVEGNLILKGTKGSSDHIQDILEAKKIVCKN